MAINHRHLKATTDAGAGWSRSWAQLTLAIALTKHGDAHEALRLGRAALAYQLPMGDNWGTTWAAHIRMWSLARLINDQLATGKTKRVALSEPATEIAYLAGGLRRQRARLGMQIENMGPFADETSAAEKAARDVLGHESYSVAEKHGYQLSPERSEPQRVALGTLSVGTLSVERSAANRTSATWEALSEAEQEVAVLAAAGWSNSAIGVRRGTSARTVDAQMSSIFEKLMIISRQEIVRFVPPDQRNRVVTERSLRPRRSGDNP